MVKLAQFLDSLNAEQLIDRLNLALDGASLGIWDWDLRDNSVQFDRRWCEMLGLAVEATPMALSTWESRVHPEDIAQCYVDIQAHIDGETTYYENIHRMRHASGDWVYILDRGRISGWDEAGNPIRFTGTHFDCTATEAAKRVLQHQRELLADMVRNLPAAVAMFDDRDRYLAASHEWLCHFGLDVSDLLAKTPAQTSARLPREWDEPRRRAHAGALSSTEQQAITDPMGRRRFLRWSIRPWRADGATVSGIIITFEDVTQAIEDRLARERESRLSALGLMAGGVAHEINTPLQSLLVNASMIQDELEADAPSLEFLAECTSSVLATTEHIHRIITALRTVSRDASGDPLSAVNLDALLADVAALCGARCRNRGVDLRLVAAREPVSSILARPADIGQILLNLLNNALDAVSGQARPWIQLERVVEAGHLRVRVVDSGPGVPEHIRDRLMTPFVTTKPLGKGTGLGLSLSRALAENLGARLEYDASARHTTFELSFPLGESRATEAGPES